MMFSRYALIQRPAWIVPFVLVAVWWGMLIGFLIVWAAQGKRLYGSQTRHMDPNYISYIGAQRGTQPVFIACSAVQGIFFVATLLLLFRFRVHGTYLPKYSSKRARNFAIASIVCGFISQLGILFVAIFNVIHHGGVHLLMVGVFVIFAFFCVLFNTFTYRLTWKRRIMWSKVVWLLFGVAFAFVFGIEYTKNKSISASFEWVLSFWYGFILILWLLDLLQASRKNEPDSSQIDTEKHSIVTESTEDRSTSNPTNAPLQNHTPKQIHRQQFLRLRLYRDYYRPSVTPPKPAHNKTPRT